MTTQPAEGISLALATDGSIDTEETFTSLVAAVTDLSETVEELRDEIDELREENEQLRDENETQREWITQLIQRVTEVENETEALDDETDHLDKRTDRLADRTSDVEAEIEQVSDDVAEAGEEAHAANKRAAKAHNRLSDMTADLGTQEGDDAGKREAPSPTPSTQPQTSMGELITTPEERLRESAVSANMRRARYIAKSPYEYTDSVMAGRAITASQVRRVLSAKNDASTHRQTAHRVMERLANLGGDGVELAERNDGKKVVVFDDETATRFRRLAKRASHRCDAGSTATPA